ncbi:MAG: hypothetical protein ACK5JR_04480 [Tropicimonas sp.]|uniref:hypothetical protein n=1 Tax=Tropicimonas sp. TaxID=2067044 RepID=UPI003A86D07A
MTDTATDLLQSFIADANAAFAEGRAGQFWPRNHHRLRPLAGKLGRLIEPQERVDFYFHFMRLNGVAIAVREPEMPLMTEAYRRLVPLFDEGGTVGIARRHVMLFLFGFDETGSLPDGETRSAAEMKARLRLIAQAGKYTSLPAQRSRKSGFLPFVDQAPRCLQALRHLGYDHDRRYGDESYNYTDLDFWGMVLVCLLNRETRSDVVSDMTSGGYSLKFPEQHAANLHRSVEAVLPDVAPQEREFLALAQRLRERERARRDATDSAALVRVLDLPFADDEDWEIQIAIPLRGTTGSPLNAPDVVRLRIGPNPDWQWELNVYLKGRGQFTETHEKGLGNDGGLPRLGAGNLRAFPAWLRQIRERNGLDFDTAAADIFVGRKRSAIPRLAGWLAG